MLGSSTHTGPSTKESLGPQEFGPAYLALCCSPFDGAVCAIPVCSTAPFAIISNTPLASLHHLSQTIGAYCRLMAADPPTSAASAPECLAELKPTECGLVLPLTSPAGGSLPATLSTAPAATLRSGSAVPRTATGMTTRGHVPVAGAELSMVCPHPAMLALSSPDYLRALRPPLLPPRPSPRPHPPLLVPLRRRRLARPADLRARRSTDASSMRPTSPRRSSRPWRVVRLHFRLCCRRREMGRWGGGGGSRAPTTPEKGNTA